MFISSTVKCDAELVVKSKFIEKDGVDYIQFVSLDMDINVKDYRVHLDGLFNGDKALGEDEGHKGITTITKQYTIYNMQYT